MIEKLAVCFTFALALTVPAAAETGTLERIRNKGEIALGYIDGAAPFSSAGAGAEPQGYSVDLCREIANGIRAQLKLAQLDTRWVALTIQNRLEAVRSGRVDIECSTTTRTLSRQAEVDFSLITFVDGASILARSDSNTRRLLDLAGKRIAVISSTTTEKVLRESLAERAIKAEVVTVESRPEGLRLVEASKVDGFAADRTTLIGLMLATEARGSFSLLDEDFSIEPYAFALARGDPDFRLAVDRVLARLYRSGQFHGIYDRWLGKLGPPSLLLSAAYLIQGLAE
jgi:glutamate/aspartate transport system substrate-binding protein